MQRENLPLAVIVIPTYNEAGSIGVIIEKFIIEIIPRVKNWRINIIVVDGNSKDNTCSIVKDLSKKYGGIYLIEENKKNGIGSAYLKGFKYGINELHADVIIEFDADFQHPPEMIISLLQKIDEGYDYVIGSRKIKGGSEPVNRNIFRLILTNFGGWLARMVLFFPSKYFSLVTDPTTGLKATRVKGCMDKLNLNEEHLFSKGFGYKVQLLYETIAIGSRFTEIPLNFQNRHSGISKFEINTAIDVLMSCLKTRVLS